MSEPTNHQVALSKGKHPFTGVFVYTSDDLEFDTPHLITFELDKGAFRIRLTTQEAEALRDAIDQAINDRDAMKLASSETKETV